MSDYETKDTVEQNFVDKQKVDMFLMTNQKYFPMEKIMFLKEKLYKLDDSKFSMVSCIEMKDPTTILIISLFLGSWGVDRFMLKETGMGVLKLLTGGLCGILTIIDWFTIQKKAKEMNFNNLMLMI
ncbi:MAG: TM2 domain-containing protein [Clostridia bacterium]|nr:TM2 domain-containing protein [Clostridia bacterium]